MHAVRGQHSNRCSVSGSTPLDDYSDADKICVVGGNQNQTDVDGDVYLSPIDLPLVPVPPSSMSDLYLNPPDITNSTTIWGEFQLKRSSQRRLQGGFRWDHPLRHQQYYLSGK